MTPKPPTHLGDCVYAQVLNHGVLMLTANNHDPRLASDTIYVEEAVLANLLKWLGLEVTAIPPK